MTKVFRQLISFLDGRDRIWIIALLILMLASAVLEMASLGLILPLSSFVFGDESAEWVVAAHDVTGLSGQSLVIAVCTAFVLLFSLKSGVIVLIQFALSRFCMNRLARFQTHLYRHYLEQPFEMRLEGHSGLLLRNLTSAASAVFDALRAFLGMALEAIVLVALLLTIAWVDPVLSLSVAAAATVLGVTYYLLTSAHLERWGSEANDLNGYLLKSAVQGLAAIKDIKVLGCAGYFENRFAGHALALAWVRTLRQVSLHLPRAILETVMVLILVAGMLTIYAHGTSIEDLMGTIGLLALVAMRAIPSLNRLLSQASDVRQFTAEVAVLYNSLKQTPDTPVAKPSDIQRLSFEGSIDLVDVSFRYREGPDLALDGLNLSIRKGEVVGVIGPSGSGKSTLIDLLLGLLPPSAGTVFVDQVDALTEPISWRANIGLVPQSIYLLDETVRENIAFGVPESEIDEGRISQILSLTALDEVVANLAQGRDTQVGEGGAKLSGGQRQRIGIARALYRDPAVLIFDEATSALDSETEQEVVQAIHGLKGTKTIIIVAHRLSTVSECDRVYLLETGRITDQGQLSELIQRHPALSAGVK